MSDGQTAQSLYFCEKSLKNRLVIGWWSIKL